MVATARKKSSQQLVKKIYDLLNKKLGSGLKDEPRTVLSQLMFNIIARNWTRTGAQKALDELRGNFVDWNEVRISPVTEITGALEVAGAPNAEKKAKNIKRILLDIYKDHHKITLDFLKDAKKEGDARKALEGLRGVSPSIVDGVLLFSLEYAVVPLYSPVARVARRTEIVDHAAEADAIKKSVSTALPSKDSERFCRLLIDHGERTCTFKDPSCKSCVLRSLCTWPERQKRHAAEAKQRAKVRAAEDARRAVQEKKQADADRKVAEKAAKEAAAKAKKTAEAKAKADKAAKAAGKKAKGKTAPATKAKGSKTAKGKPKTAKTAKKTPKTTAGKSKTAKTSKKATRTAGKSKTAAPKKKTVKKAAASKKKTVKPAKSAKAGKASKTAKKKPATRKKARR